MTFSEFQAMNRARCEAGFKHSVEPHGSWPFQNWALAIAGESGELCNLVKKVLRGDFPLEDKRVELLKELADIITYADLMVSSLSGDTGTEVLSKFQEVSRRIGYTG